MSERTAPKLTKWPFFAGDLLLVALAIWIVNHYPHPLPNWPLFFVTACVAGGAWIAVQAFLVEYRAKLNFAEAESLTTAVEEINNLRNLANQISFATAQWQVVQEHSGRTVEESGKIADRMTSEARSFTEFMQKANDAQKAHLQLEVEKLRRGEADWVEVLVHVLDHVYALFQAGVRSGQPALIGQLGNFQNACRETVRRVGLIPIEAKVDDPFNPKTHQLPDPNAQVPEGSRVAAMLAPGFTFQGQLVRRIVVGVIQPPAVESDAMPVPAMDEPAPAAGEELLAQEDAESDPGNVS